MKITGNNIYGSDVPLIYSDNLLIIGGTGIQHFDGVNFLPNRESIPGSPLIIKHVIDFKDPTGLMTVFPYSTLFYANDVLITAQTPGYEILSNNELKVTKNVPHGTTVVIRADSEMLDTRTGLVYKVSNKTYLRTILKAPAPYQLELSPSGRQLFDAHRNPNTIQNITAVVKLDGENITDYSGITFKWLNSDGLDCVDNELYADKYTNNRTLTIDKTYIDHESIKCEAWMDGKIIAFDTVTFVRHWHSLDPRVDIPQLPINGLSSILNCNLLIKDTVGQINVDAGYLVDWMLKEGTAAPRKVGSNAVTTVPVSSINLKASPIELYPDIKRRLAWAGLETSDGFILVDDNDNVLTVEDYGI